MSTTTTKNDYDLDKLDFTTVKVKPEVLNTYPATRLDESNIVIADTFTFSAMTYKRPVGDSDTGSLVVEVISTSGKLHEEHLDLRFKYTENERFLKAQQIDSFKIDPTALVTKLPQHFAPDDISNYFDDVEIEAVEFVAASKQKLNGNLLINYRFRVGEKLSTLFTVSIPIDLVDRDTPELNNLSQTGGLDVNILKVVDWEVQEGLSLTLEEITNYSISEDFINGAPPLVVSRDIIEPAAGIRLRKVEYVPPADIESTFAYLQVQYWKNKRIHSERVKFEFKMSIMDEAKKVVASIDPSDVKYEKSERMVAPTMLRDGDFSYHGSYAIEIVGVDYNYDLIDPDNRFITFNVILTYRTVHVKLQKRLEFQFSKNEYIKGKWAFAKTENGSVSFIPKFKEPANILKIIEGNNKLRNEMINTTKIVDGYNYDKIKDIKVINFNKDSRLAMFKVTAIEFVGKIEAIRSFEKQIEMVESYEEYILSTIKENDLVINERILPPYPPEEVLERIFKSDDRFNILSIQYVKPKPTDKEIEILVKIGAGKKTRFLTKVVKWDISKLDYDQGIWEQESMEYVKLLDPSYIFIDIDTEGEPLEKITKEDITGIPTGIEFEVDYTAPIKGSNYTRIKIRLVKGTQSVVYEQSIEFGRNRTW